MRDPATRFVSAFNMRFRMQYSEYRKYLTDKELKTFQSFDSANELAESLSSSDPLRQQMAMTAMKGTYFIKETLQQWLISLKYLKRRRDDILYIGRQETMKQDFDKIKKIIGLPDSLLLPKDRNKANRAPANSKTYISKLGLRNLRNFYQEDYKILEFCEQVQTEQNQMKNF